MLTLVVNEETIPLADVYLTGVSSEVRLEDPALLGFPNPHNPAFKLILVDLTRKARALDDLRVNSMTPMLTPFGNGFTAIAQVGGPFLEKLSPQLFESIEPEMAVKSIFAIPDGTLTLFVHPIRLCLLVFL